MVDEGNQREPQDSTVLNDYGQLAHRGLTIAK